MSTVQNILDKKGTFVASKNRDDSVFDATKVMVEKRIGSVVVCDGNKVVGIFTERDVLCRIIAEQRDPMTTTLGEVMTTPVACCVPETSFEELRGVMTEKRIRRIPVVKDNKKYISVNFRIQDMPSYVEIVLADKLVRKLRDEYGDPPLAQVAVKKAKPAKKPDRAEDEGASEDAPEDADKKKKGKKKAEEE